MPPTAMSLCVCPVCVRVCACVHVWQRVRVREHPGVRVPGLCLCPTRNKHMVHFSTGIHHKKIPTAKRT